MNNKRISQPSIQIRIEELVLHGFDSAKRYAIADAMQSELTRLFSERGASAALWGGGEALSLNAGSFRVTSSMKVETIGSQVAQSIYASLNPPNMP